MKTIPILSLALVLANSALADTESYYAFGQVRSVPPGPISFTFDITPFDTALGTLNSVTVTAEVNVSGSAQLWSADEEAVLTVRFSNSLAALSELGWSSTVANFTDSSPLWYYDYEYMEGYVQLTGSGNIYRGPTTITSGFGRFEGGVPFPLDLNLSAEVTSTGGPGDTLLYNYTGDARLTYEYDFTPAPIPEPATLTLLSLGFLCFAHPRRTSRK